MKKNPSRIALLLLFLILTLVAGSQSVKAQELLSLAQGTIAINGAYKKAHVGTNGFNAQVRATYKDTETGKTNLSYSLLISQCGTKLRSEARVTDMAAMPPQVKTAIIRLGIDEIITIHDTTSNAPCFIFPGIQGFVTIQMPEAIVKATRVIMNSDVQHVPLGEEIWQGHYCRKEKLSHANDPISPMVWLRKDLDWFPGKIEGATRNEILSFETLSVDMTVPGPSQFEIPNGYKRYSSYAEVREEAIARFKKAK